MMGDPRMGTNAYEERHGVRMPIQVYPLFENAYRARNGWSLTQHRERLGQLWSSMTKVAARNPYAWFPKERSASEIVTATPDNRIICFPYTKLMYVHAAADATDGWWCSERESFARSPILHNCVNAALDGAGIDANAVSHF